ncbi:PadR family transcriptional regulator [Streptomyces roseolilacinus]|uniref:PadR family transcriptional regulator n=1 Tax=Streptomyces roseolilacinus TaxID=66904 RepID=A0A918EIV5_9ACTN|nr:PadR family transcriptional regulator [Streptomyces roseolilacinus]GGP88007.1 PadR family transcriptional regulator [Streptomyces roseolilacinus]
MPSVFAHGRLRLYLLKLLDEAPRHGYEVIRLLEERFQGLYAPSAGTVYPRLAKLEAEGLVRHASEGGRKVYSITDAGRAELAARRSELAHLEQEIREAVAELTTEVRDDARDPAGRPRGGIRTPGGTRRTGDRPGGGQEWEAWRTAKEELRRARQEWHEQTRRAKDEARRAREEAQNARRQAQEAQERVRQEVQKAAQQVQEHLARGDWPSGVRDGLADLTDRLGGLLGGPGGGSRPPGTAPGPGPVRAPDRAGEAGAAGDPVRDLERLLDRFRDEVRDAARDHGVTPGQLSEVRRHLAAAADRVTSLLRPDGD